MAPEIENLVLEHLRYIRTKVDRIKADVMDVKRPVTSLEIQVATLHTDFANQPLRIDRIEGCLDRIERRLDLTPAQL